MLAAESFSVNQDYALTKKKCEQLSRELQKQNETIEKIVLY